MGSSIKLSGFWFGLEIGLQIGKVIIDVWREVKKEMAEKDKPTVCLDCPLAKAIETTPNPPAKTRKLKIIK